MMPTTLITAATSAMMMAAATTPERSDNARQRPPRERPHSQASQSADARATRLSRVGQKRCPTGHNLPQFALYLREQEISRRVNLSTSLLRASMQLNSNPER